MRRLTANYNLRLLGGALSFRARQESRRYETTLNGFDVAAVIQSTGEKAKTKRDRLWTHWTNRLAIRVSRHESTPWPTPSRTDRGGRDFTNVVPYFQDIEPAYSAVAFTVATNLASYFRFELRHPIRLPRATDFPSPQWLDESGTEIDTGLIVVTGSYSPAGVGFGAIPVAAEHDAAVKRALTTARVPTLWEQLLSDAQAAALDGNIRRAVLELAVSCEIFIKHRFLGGSDPSGQLFAALEDRRAINVRVIDLIEIAGETLLGSRFGAYDKAAFTDLDHLFRARNRVAHRGDASYKDDRGKVHAVDRKVLTHWWASFDKLVKWAK